jgi:hypothetical protein
LEWALENGSEKTPAKRLKRSNIPAEMPVKKEKEKWYKKTF